MSTEQVTMQVPVFADSTKYLPTSDGVNLGDGWYARVVDGFPMGGLIAFGEDMEAACKALSEALIEAIASGTFGGIELPEEVATDRVRLLRTTGKTFRKAA